MDENPDVLEHLSADEKVAMAVVAAYAVAVVVWLHPSTFAHMLGGAFAFFGAVIVLARRLGSGGPAPMTIPIVSTVGLMALAVPNLPATQPGYFAPAAIGLLGSQAGVLLWISLRWPADATPKPRIFLPESLLFGLIGAAFVSAVAAIPIGLGLLARDPEAVTLLWVFPAYFGAALAASTFYWLLQGIAHRPTGRYLIGTLGGFCVYGAIGPVVALLDGEPVLSGEIALGGLLAGMLVGPPVAMAWNDQFG